MHACLTCTSTPAYYCIRYLAVSSMRSCPQEGGKEKSSSYECFHAHDDIITVAVFAPDTASRVVDTSVHAAATHATGQIILTAGYSGEIKVFENLSASPVQ